MTSINNEAKCNIVILSFKAMKGAFYEWYNEHTYFCAGDSGSWKDDAVPVEKITAGATYVCAREPAGTISQNHWKGKIVNTHMYTPTGQLMSCLLI